MITYRFLTNFPTDRLHSAFLSAFTDYLVSMHMSLPEFEYRLQRDGVNTSLSAGAFYNDELVGFYLNGTGQWQGISTIYDDGESLPETIAFYKVIGFSLVLEQYEMSLDLQTALPQKSRMLWA